jgi:hypothetical protein
VDGPVLGEALLDGLLDYWSSKRAGRIMPERPDIDPVEMGPKLLPHLMITEFREHGSQVRVRLCGTAAVARLGCDPTGRAIAGTFNAEFSELLLGLHREVYRHATPVFSERTFGWKDGRRLLVQLLLLPLALRSPVPDTAPAQVLLGLRARSDSHRTPSWCADMELVESRETRGIVFVEFAGRNGAGA